MIKVVCKDVLHAKINHHANNAKSLIFLLINKPVKV